MSFTFYATFPAGGLASYVPHGIPILLPASSWARYGLKPPRLPEQITDYAADSGGYVASKLWGDYRYSLHEYVDSLPRLDRLWLTMWQQANFPQQSRQSCWCVFVWTGLL